MTIALMNLGEWHHLKHVGYQHGFCLDHYKQSSMINHQSKIVFVIIYLVPLLLGHWSHRRKRLVAGGTSGLSRMERMLMDTPTIFRCPALRSMVK